MQIIAKLVGLLLGGVVAASLARGLGASGFGSISAALAVVSIAAIASDMGLMAAAAAEMSREDDTFAVGRLAGGIVLGRFLLSLPLVGLALIVVGQADGAIRPASVAIAASLALAPFAGLGAVSHAALRPSAATRAHLSQALVWAVAATVCAWRGSSPVWYGVSFLVSQIVLVSLLTVSARQLVRVRIRGALRTTRRLLASCWRIGLASLIWMVFQRLPLLVLDRFGSGLETGLLAGALRYADAGYLIPATMSTLLVPLMAASTPSALRRIVDLAVRIMVTACGALAVSSPFWASRVSTFVFGAEFSGLTTATVLVMLMVVLFAVDVIFGSMLVAQGRPSALLWSAAAGLAVTIVGMATTHASSAVAAAAVLVVAQLVRTVVLLRACHATVPGPPAAIWGQWLAVGASAVVAGAMLQAFGPPLLAAPLSAGLFMAGCLGFRILRWADAAQLLTQKPAR